MAHISRFARLVAVSFAGLSALGALACSASVTSGKTSDPGTGGGDNTTTSSTSAGGGSKAVDDSCTTLEAGQSRPCALATDAPDAPTGVETCEEDASNNWGWTACAEPPPSSGSTPLVLVFNQEPVAFRASVGAFDVAATMSVLTDWPTGATPWLAFDRNGNGAIDDGAELFGSATVLKSGERATNGFIALAELDSNGDGRITPEDAAWSTLRLWSDIDGDRSSAPGELAPLGARRILSIELGYRSERRCDGRGNCEIERAPFRWADEAGVEHTGAIVDVHLRHQSTR